MMHHNSHPVGITNSLHRESLDSQSIGRYAVGLNHPRLVELDRARWAACGVGDSRDLVLAGVREDVEGE
jgi:hypothetical protein